MSIAQPVRPSDLVQGRGTLRLGTGTLVTLAILACFSLSWAHLAEVWRTGTFFDTDDAMRMVQVRDWLAGQGWFDLRAHRLSPPDGLLMHWSRIVDLPLGALVRLFALFAPPLEAERLARIVFPLGCQVLLVLAFLRAARVLCGPEATVPALLVIVLNGFEFGQFVAGRVDHHAPQIVLLVTFVGAIAAGLRGAGWKSALLAACAAALSLGISLENLPFIAVGVTAVALAWLWRGDPAAGFARAFGLGFAGFASLVFAATVPPSRYAVVANDAFSAPHALLVVLGGLGLWLLPQWPAARATAVRRGLGLLGLGLGTIGTVRVLCPGFPASPYAAVDPLVQALWLRHVTEALPLATSVSLHPAGAVLIVVPVVSGLLAASWAAVASRVTERGAWAFLAAVTATGLIGACWEVRVASSAMPLAALGGVWAVTQAARGAWLRGVRSSAVRTVVALIPFSPILCAFLPMPEEAAAVTNATAAAAACRDASALTPLATLPAGLAFAPIDIGAHLLAHTSLSVLAGPYHRNNAGNRAVLEGFSAAPGAAQAKVEATGARYVAVCLGESQLDAIAQAAPDSLAGALLRNEAPAWLTPLPLSDTPYRVYRVQ